MLQSASMNVYPVFPNWIFEGEVYLTKDIVESIVHDLNKVPKVKQNYGWCTEKNQITPVLQNLRKLVGNMFYENASAKFNMREKKHLTIESVDAQIFCVAPGHQTQATVSRLRWYQAVTFIKCENNASDISLNLLSDKLHTAPLAFESTTHTLSSQPFKTYFWPAHIPWNFSVNKSTSPTIALVNSFIIKKINS